MCPVKRTVTRKSSLFRSEFQSPLPPGAQVPSRFHPPSGRAERSEKVKGTSKELVGTPHRSPGFQVRHPADDIRNAGFVVEVKDRCPALSKICGRIRLDAEQSGEVLHADGHERTSPGPFPQKRSAEDVPRNARTFVRVCQEGTELCSPSRVAGHIQDPRDAGRLDLPCPALFDGFFGRSSQVLSRRASSLSSWRTFSTNAGTSSHSKSMPFQPSWMSSLICPRAEAHNGLARGHVFQALERREP